MTDRVKLVKLIDEVAEGMIIQRCGEFVCTVNSDEIADHLLAHGVTVKEQQRPLTLAEMLGVHGPVWYEYRRSENPIPVIPAIVEYSYSSNFLDIHTLGSTSVLSMRGDAYSKTWRCWAEKPTEQERKAAEWEK